MEMEQKIANNATLTARCGILRAQSTLQNLRAQLWGVVRAHGDMETLSRECGRELAALHQEAQDFERLCRGLYEDKDVPK